MNRTAGNENPHTTAASAPQWFVLGLLAAATAAALVGLGRASAPAAAQNTQTGASASGEIVAVAGQLSRNSYGLFLIDTRRGGMVVYEYDGEQLHLRAARTYIFDTQLESLNTSRPEPADVADMLRLGRPIEQPGPSQP